MMNNLCVGEFLATSVASMDDHNLAWHVAFVIIIFILLCMPGIGARKVNVVD